MGIKRFARDCFDQIVRSLFWSFVIALVIARCFLGDRDALAVSGTVMEHASPVISGASVVLIGIRRVLGR